MTDLVSKTASTWSVTLGAQTFTIKASSRFLTFQLVGAGERNDVTMAWPFQGIATIHMNFDVKEDSYILCFKSKDYPFTAEQYIIYFNLTRSKEFIAVHDRGRFFHLNGLGDRAQQYAYDLMEFLTGL